MDKHPLRLYLDRRDEYVNDFAARAGVNRVTIFRLMAGQQLARVGTLDRIERATGGDVTIRMMTAWYDARRQAA